MSREADNRHYVRRVVLPSGKTIEVVYFDESRRSPAVGFGIRRGRRRPAHLRHLRLGPRLPRRVGRGRRDALGGHAALPQLRVDRHRRLRAGPSSSASTRSSTAAPRRSSATSSAWRTPTWRTRSSASSPRSRPITSSRTTSRPSRRLLGRPQVGEHRQHPAVVVVAGGQVELGEDVATCFSTAPPLTTSARATAAFERPSAMSSSTSRSRGVSAASAASPAARRARA